MEYMVITQIYFSGYALNVLFNLFLITRHICQKYQSQTIPFCSYCHACAAVEYIILLNILK